MNRSADQRVVEIVETVEASGGYVEVAEEATQQRNYRVDLSQCPARRGREENRYAY